MRQGDYFNTLVSVPLSAYWIKENRAFEQMAGYDFAGPGFNLAGGSEPERLRGIRVTANFFRLVGVNPVLGRATFSRKKITPVLSGL